MASGSPVQGPGEVPGFQHQAFRTAVPGGGGRAGKGSQAFPCAVCPGSEPGFRASSETGQDQPKPALRLQAPGEAPEAPEAPGPCDCDTSTLLLS